MKTGRPKGTTKPDSISGKARAAGLPVYLVFWRLKAGWTEKEALEPRKVKEIWPAVDINGKSSICWGSGGVKPAEVTYLEKSINIYDVEIVDLPMIVSEEIAKGNPEIKWKPAPNFPGGWIESNNPNEPNG